MTPEERHLLEEALALSKENNEILKKLYRSFMWGRAIKVVYWLILIALTVGSFFLIQPYVDSLKDTYGQVLDTKAQFGNLFGGE